MAKKNKLVSINAYVYDNMGRQTTLTQPDSGEVHFTYWPTGELRKTWGARTYPAEYTYDEQGRMKTLTTWQDYSGNGGTAVTTWVYNPVTGLLVQKLYADNQGPSYTYTLAGRKLTRTWARGMVTTYAYNTAGEQSGVTYSDGTPGAAYQFDRAGRQQSVTDATGATTFTYAALGERLGEAHAGGLLDGVSMAYAYDTLRRPQQLTATIGTATVQTSYTYDAASRLASVSNGAHSAAYGYLSDSNLVGTVTFSGSAGTVMTTTKSYDGLNRLTAIATASGTPATTKTRYDYLYNTANQRIRATLADGSYWVYQYDALGQVVSGRKFNAANAPVPGMGFGYAFDDIGNRKQASSLAANGQPAAQSDYTANQLNQYTARMVPGIFDLRGDANPAATVTVTSPADATSPSAIHATARQGAWWHAAVPVSNTAAAVRQNAKVTGVLKGQGTDGKDIVAEQTQGSFFVPQTPEAFTYDADGNLTADGRWSYTWDGENRLIAMTPLGTPAAGALRLEYVYDADGRRVAKKAYAWATGQWQLTKDTRFLYDGRNLLAELSFDVGSSTLAVERSYAWGLDLSGSLQGAGGVGGLLFATSHTSSPATQCYAYDGNGNVVALISAANGAESAYYEYDPFGNILVSNGTAATINRFRFSTKYNDAETSLLYYGSRYYGLVPGRWLSRDTLEEDGGLGLYVFVNNEPVSSIDVFGQWAEDVHKDKTRVWAGQLGYPLEAATAIGDADIAVDGGTFGGGNGWAPWGDQSYHFNRPWNEGGKERDSRTIHFREHFKNAKLACADKPRQDDPQKAAAELGTALHPMQDYYAHGDYGHRAGGNVWVTHNILAPSTSRVRGVKGGVDDYPDNEMLDAVGSRTGRPARADHAKAYYAKDIWGAPGEWYYYELRPGTGKRIMATARETREKLTEWKKYLDANAKTCCECRRSAGSPTICK